MGFLKANQILKDGVHKLWPEYRGQVAFLPDMEFADAISDCLRGLCKYLRCPADVIAEKLVPLFPEGYKCKSVNDFLNIDFDVLAEDWGEREKLFDAVARKRCQTLSIILPQFTKYAPQDEFFRLSAVAVLQLLCARIVHIRSELRLSTKVLIGYDEELSLKKCFQAVLDECRDAKPISYNEVKTALADVIDKCGAERICLWLAPSSMTKGEFNHLYHEKLRNDERVRLRCLPRSWLTGCSDFNEINLEKWSEQELASLAVYMAAPRHGENLQVCTAQFAESDNLLWLLPSLNARLSKLSWKKHLTWHNKGVKAAFYLPYFFQSAVYEGEVTEYVKVLEDFLQCALEVIGDHKLRMRIEKNELDEEETGLLTVIEYGLQDEMSYWKGYTRA